MTKHLFIRISHECGYIGVLTTEYGEELEIIKTRSVQYLQRVACYNNATIFPRKFRRGQVL